MDIAGVIRKYRRELGLTQEELASRLSVTASAVNKWENGRSLPDVAQLAPLARLLGITTDTLLAFQEEPSAQEIQDFLHSLEETKQQQGLAEALALARKKTAEYPCCAGLLWQAAAILGEGCKLDDAAPDVAECRRTVREWYERCLVLREGSARRQAAVMLFCMALEEEAYEEALRCAAFLGKEDPERKRLEARVLAKTGKRQEARRSYEELIFTGYLMLEQALSDLRAVSMEEGDHETAHWLAHIEGQAAAVFEMGRYHELGPELDIAVWEKDAPRTVQLLKELFDSVETLNGFTGSKLYQHMVLKKPDAEFFERLRRSFLTALKDESYAFLRGSREGEAFLEKAKSLEPS